MKTFALHPLAGTFIRLTLTITVGIAAIILAFVILKVVLVAALIAGLVIGVLFLYNLFRRGRLRLPVPR